MNITVTLIAQMIAFGAFVWFCMKFVWPPIVKALADRQQNIADGLAAAEKGRHEHQLAEKRATEVLHEARGKYNEILAMAEKRATEIVEEAKGQAKVEAERVMISARADIEQERNQAREKLRAAVADLAVQAAGQILRKEVDRSAHARMLDEFSTQL